MSGRVKDGNAAAGRGAPAVPTSAVRAGDVMRRARVTTAHGRDPRGTTSGASFTPARG
jgi:hypothetical protein